MWLRTRWRGSGNANRDTPAAQAAMALAIEIGNTHQLISPHEQQLDLLGAEGKILGREFCKRLLRSGVKPSISGDLWSDGGMSLFGI